MTEKGIEQIISPGYTAKYIDFLVFNASDKPVSVRDDKIFDFINQRESIKVIGGTPYIYNSGVFRADRTGARLKTMIKECIYPPLIKSNTINRIYELFMQDYEIQAEFDEMNALPPHFINFENGVLNAKTLELIPHNPQQLFTNQIPHSWTAERTEPKTTALTNWFDFIFESDSDKEMFLQFSGLCLTRDTRQEKFLILNGKGGTGKSILIDLLEKAVGTENTSNIPIDKLNQRFATYSLVGKLLNSCADLKISVLTDLATVKQLTGRDSLTAERKGKDIVSFKNYSKLIFSTNKLPVIRNESTNAFYRRLLILNLNKQPIKIDTELSEKVCENIDYFIFLAVQALHRMFTDYGGIIAESENSKTAVKSMREENDIVQAFINSETHIEIGARTDRSLLFERFENYCFENEKPQLSKTEFYSDMKNKGYAIVKYNDINSYKNIALNYEFCSRQ